MEPERTYVEQEDRSGCMIACVAMITGRPYSEIREGFLRLYEENDGLPEDFQLTACGNGAGVELHQAIHLLAVYGYEPNFLTSLFPLVAFLARVEYEHHSHGVVIYADGAARDPDNPSIQYVKDLPEITQMIPIVDRMHTQRKRVNRYRRLTWPFDIGDEVLVHGDPDETEPHRIVDEGVVWMPDDYPARYYLIERSDRFVILADGKRTRRGERRRYAPHQLKQPEEAE